MTPQVLTTRLSVIAHHMLQDAAFCNGSRLAHFGLTCSHPYTPLFHDACHSYFIQVVAYQLWNYSRSSKFTVRFQPICKLASNHHSHSVSCFPAQLYICNSRHAFHFRRALSGQVLFESWLSILIRYDRQRYGSEGQRKLQTSWMSATCSTPNYRGW